MIDDQVDTEEIEENRKRREIDAIASDVKAPVAPNQTPTTIDADPHIPQKPWGKRIWTQLGAWGIRTHVRHPRPE